MSSPSPYPRPGAVSSRGADGLADILERVLDKGLVIAGDIQVNLLDIELLTIKVRLLLASADTAREMGIDWWEHDPFLSGRARGLEAENAALRERLERLEALVGGDNGGRRAIGDAAGGEQVTTGPAGTGG